MKHRVDGDMNRLGNRFDGSAKPFAIFMAIMAILLISSADDMASNISEDVSLNAGYIDVTMDVYEAESNTAHRFEINGRMESAKYEIYKITVINNGYVRLESVTLSAVLAKGMKFMNTSYLEAGRGIPEVEIDPGQFNENKETNVSWNLGYLAPEEIKSVIMAVYLKQDGVQASDVFAAVTGKTIDGTAVTDSQSSADIIPECGWFAIEDDGTPVPCEEATAEFNPRCKEICPDWIKSFSPP